MDNRGFDTNEGNSGSNRSVVAKYSDVENEVRLLGLEEEKNMKISVRKYSLVSTPDDSPEPSELGEPIEKHKGPVVEMVEMRRKIAYLEENDIEDVTVTDPVSNITYQISPRGSIRLSSKVGTVKGLMKDLTKEDKRVKFTDADYVSIRFSLTDEADPPPKIEKKRILLWEDIWFPDLIDSNELDELYKKVKSSERTDENAMVGENGLYHIPSTEVWWNVIKYGFSYGSGGLLFKSTVSRH